MFLRRSLVLEGKQEATLLQESTGLPVLHHYLSAAARRKHLFRTENETRTNPRCDIGNKITTVWRTGSIFLLLDTFVFLSWCFVLGFCTVFLRVSFLSLVICFGQCAWVALWSRCWIKIGHVLLSLYYIKEYYNSRNYILYNYPSEYRMNRNRTLPKIVWLNSQSLHTIGWKFSRLQKNIELRSIDFLKISSLVAPDNLELEPLLLFLIPNRCFQDPWRLPQTLWPHCRIHYNCPK